MVLSSLKNITQIILRLLSKKIFSSEKKTSDGERMTRRTENYGDGGTFYATVTLSEVKFYPIKNDLGIVEEQKI